MDDDEAQARGGADTPSAADAGCGGRNPTAAGGGAEAATATRGRTKAEVAAQLMEQVVERGNMWRAYERVLRNKGAPGADGMRVQDLKAWLQTHWPSVKAALLAGSYLPREVRAVDIPKPSGGDKDTGRANRGGPADPASGAASPATDLRGRVQPVELRLQTRAQRVAGGASRQGPRQGRPSWWWTSTWPSSWISTSWCPLVYEVGSNKPGCSSKTLILKPFLRP